MNLDALFKITYGLFVTGVASDGKLGGCVINTAAQVTAEPPRMIVTMQKQNHTAGLILEKGSIALSILSKDCPMDVVRHFGQHSGRDMNKFSNTADYELDRLGNPVLSLYTCATAALHVEKTLDVDTHWLFLCPVADAAITSEQPGLTYDDYRAGGVSSRSPAQVPLKKRTCVVCHYVYDGQTPFDALPDDWVCPICGVGKEQFALV